MRKLWFARSEDGDEFLVQAETEDQAFDLLEAEEGTEPGSRIDWLREVHLEEGVTVLLRQR